MFNRQYVCVCKSFKKIDIKKENRNKTPLKQQQTHVVRISTQNHRYHPKA